MTAASAPAALSVRERPRRRVKLAAAIDIDRVRLEAPAARPGDVRRTALVNRLRAESSSSVLTLLAPAGYGKSTLLAQWAERDERPFAWVSIDEDDNDPAELLRDLAAALGHVGLLDLPGPEPSGDPKKAVRQLAWTLRGVSEPFVLVLDDVHRLRSQGSVALVAELTQRFPAGSLMALSGRFTPRLPLARLRAGGLLAEFGVDDIAFSRREAELLLRSAGLEDSTEAGEIVERTEGWAAGLCLAAEDGGEGRVAEYVREEQLAHLSDEDLSFLTRTSVLETMCGSLCDDVLETTGSARRLDALRRSNLFIVPLGGEPEAYRYHRQVRDVLRAELARREPEIAQALNRRAAAWCQANGASDAAISYAHASGDCALLARLVEPRILAALSAGEGATVESWLDWFDSASLDEHPLVRVLGAWVYARRGHPAAAERWLESAVRAPVEEVPPDGSDSMRSWITVVRAALCGEGPGQVLADAEYALDELGPSSRWRPIALFLRAAAHALLGETDRAAAGMAGAADEAEYLGMTPFRIAALAERSLLEAARGDEDRARSLALHARGLVNEHRLEHDAMSAIAFAASARRALREGHCELARTELEKVSALRPRLTYALPWYSVRTSLEAARAHVALLDVPGARGWLAHAEEIRCRRPALGVLELEAKSVEREVDQVMQAQAGRASELTPAELRLLPLLATHLSFREIGERLFISRNTVKTQAISVYRKLGASSRSEAIERAAALGLVPLSATRTPAIALSPDAE